MNEPRRRALGCYLLAAVLACAGAAWALDLAAADLRVPLWYDADALYYGMVVKAVGEQGWWLTNPRLGMPFGQQMHDFPMPDTLSFLLLRALALVAEDHALRMNLFFLASFPLTALTALWALRRLGSAPAPALLASILFCLLPYRLLLGEYHLLYTSYWAVPLLLPVLVGIGTGEVTVGRARDLGAPRVLACLPACVASASTGGVYQPFFAGFLLLVVAGHAWARQRRPAAVLLPLALIACTGAVLLLNLLPSILYRWREGATATARRSPFEPDLFGLEITSLLLPVRGHPIDSWAAARAAYEATPIGRDGSMMALGLLGSAGLLFLLGWLLFAPRRAERPAAGTLDVLGVLGGSTILLATIGGFGTLFSYLGSPQIRGYAYSVVHVALFAQAAVALLLTGAQRRWAGSAARRRAFTAATAVLLALALLDQTPPHPCPDPALTRQDHARDREFFAALEQDLPEGAMVFQLPRHDFPEGEFYEHLKAYLHTDHLRFSFGAMRERRADRWQRHVLAQPAAALADTLAAAGFAGICFDRWLGGPDGAAREAAVLANAGGPSRVSANGRYAFVRLPEPGGPDADRRRELALHPVLVEWGSDFVGTPRSADDWRGCGARGEIVLDNWLPRPRPVRLALTLIAPARGSVRVTGAGLAEEVAVGPQAAGWAREIVLPPGRTTLVLVSAAPAVRMVDTLPPMAFGVRDLTVHDGGR